MLYHDEKIIEKIGKFSDVRAATGRIRQRPTPRAPRAPTPRVRWRWRARQDAATIAARQGAPAGRAAAHPPRWAAAPPLSRARDARERGWVLPAHLPWRGQ